MAETTKVKVPSIFGALVDRYLKLYDRPMPELFPACWELETGDFVLAMNPHNEPRLGGPIDGMRCDVPPASLGIWRNGWLVGLVDPYGGALMGNMENEIIAAIESAPAPAASGE